LRHYVLHADREELLRRIETDATIPGSPWRHERLADYEAARAWHNQDAHVIDTTSLQPDQVAKLIAADTDVLPSHGSGDSLVMTSVRKPT
jgi:hypothetical protein